jgi:hypothetical protein
MMLKEPLDRRQRENIRPQHRPRLRPVRQHDNLDPSERPNGRRVWHGEGGGWHGASCSRAPEPIVADPRQITRPRRAGASSTAPLALHCGASARSHSSNRLHAKLCDHEITRITAQREIARSWVSTYHRLFG